MRYLFSFLILSLMLSLNAQQSGYKYWVKFTDKGCNLQLLSTPENFLSQRAIDRRVKSNKSITQKDLPICKEYKNQLQSDLNVRTVAVNKWFNAICISSESPIDLEKLNKYDFVKSSELLFKPMVVRSGNNKFELETIQEEYNYGISKTQIELINIDALHQKGLTGEGFVIAILDAGFRDMDKVPAVSHVINEQLLGTRNYVNNLSIYDILNSHGFNVTSTIAAKSDGNYVGTAPDAKFYLLSTEDVTSETLVEEVYWAAGAEFADSAGVDIINSSLGYTKFDIPAQNHSYADMDGNTTIITKAADLAAQRGILVVNSAGNSGNNSWKYIGAPADGDSVFSIGATWPDGSLANFSSRGPTSDGDLKPNVSACGMNVAVVAFSQAKQQEYFGYSAGTSFSSPTIAGAAATLWQAFPYLTNMQIKEAIEQSAHLYDNPNNDFGYGIPDFGKAYDILSNKYKALEQGKMVAFPNPTNNKVNVFLNSGELIQKILVINNNGKVVFSQDLKTEERIRKTFDLSTLQNGVYQITIESKKNSYSQKVIKY